MSEPPPFPVPRGMEWDGVKKRFFKPVPGTARAAIANGFGDGSASKRKKASKERREVEDVYEQELSNSSLNEVASKLSNRAVVSRFADRTFGRGSRRTPLTVPTIADVQAAQQSVALNVLSRAKLVRRTCPYATHAVRLLHAPRTLVRMLSSSSLGALLFFFPNSDVVRGLDIGSGTEEAFSVEQGWMAKPKPFQTSTTLQSTMVSSPSDSNLSRPSSSAMDGPYMTFFASPSFVRILRLNTTLTSQTTGRCFQAVRITECGVDSQWCESGVPVLCTRDLDNGQECIVIVLIAIGRRLAVLRATGTERAGEVSNLKTSRYDERVKSDILACDICPNGQQAILGLRNGQVHVVQIPPMHSNARLTSKSLTSRYDSAITNIKWTSLDDFIVSTVSGEVHLISLRNSDVPQVIYAGHVNRWMVDVAMAIDTSNRLFALAGQDCHVRIWSFDHPMPLSASLSANPIQSLSSTALPEPILSLTFCQRQDVSRLEANQNVTFLPRGLPALAVYCGDGAVHFFE